MMVEFANSTYRTQNLHTLKYNASTSRTNAIAPETGIKITTAQTANVTINQRTGCTKPRVLSEASLKLVVLVALEAIVNAVVLVTFEIVNTSGCVAPARFAVLMAEVTAAVRADVLIALAVDATELTIVLLCTPWYDALNVTGTDARRFVSTIDVPLHPSRNKYKVPFIHMLPI